MTELHSQHDSSCSCERLLRDLLVRWCLGPPLQAVLEDAPLRVEVVELDVPFQTTLVALAAGCGAAPGAAATVAAREVAEQQQLAQATADAIFGH